MIDWGERPLVNVGDDWGLQTLAWTKMSYRPVKMLKKFVMRPANRVALSPGLNVEIPPPASEGVPAHRQNILCSSRLPRSEA